MHPYEVNLKLISECKGVLFTEAFVFKKLWLGTLAGIGKIINWVLPKNNTFQ